MPTQVKLRKPIPRIPDITDPNLLGAFLNYKVPNSAKDFSVHGNNGIAGSGVRWKDVGALFNGTNPGITLGAHVIDLSGTNTFTLCAWTKWNGGNTGNHKDIIHLGNSEVVLRNADNEEWQIYFNDGVKANIDSISSSGDENIWVFLCGIYDGTKLTLSKNTIPSGSPLLVSTNVRSAPTADGIGYKTSGVRHFPGQIREAEIYADAWIEKELENRFELGVLE